MKFTTSPSPSPSPSSPPPPLPLLLSLLLILLISSLTSIDSVKSDCTTDLASTLETLSNLTLEFSTLNSSYFTLQQNYSTCQISLNDALNSINNNDNNGSHDDDDEESCSSSLDQDYNSGLHIGAIFIILSCSILGVALPLIGKYFSYLKVGDYWIIVGKCAGTGIVLACALIHMLLPASESLTSSCLPPSFSEEYGAYAFLFALIAAIVMQFIEVSASEYMMSKQSLDPNHNDNNNNHNNNDSDNCNDNDNDNDNCPNSQTSIDMVQIDPTSSTTSSSSTGKSFDKVETHSKSRPHSHSHSSHSHSHIGGLLLDARIERTISAYLLEFGITVHSVFIGLTVGVSSESELKGLLVALCFHQFFEGVALGSRFCDAELSSRWQEFVLSTIFAISAPLGIMIGVIVTTNINTNGETFLFVQGIFDAVCAGILLYIGFILLIKDFPEDSLKVKSLSHPKYRRAGMFIALWAGAGLMAFLGKYL